MTQPTIIYNWKIEGLDVATSQGDLQEVVRMVHWRLLASDGLNTADCYGETLLNEAGSEEFIPYPELTPETVISWLEEAINSRAREEEPTIQQLRDCLAGVLSFKREPEIIPIPLPWE